MNTQRSRILRILPANTSIPSINNWEFRGTESNLVLWKLNYESVALVDETFHVFPQLGG